MKTIANGSKISSYVNWVSLNSIHYTGETIPLLLSQSKWSHSMPTRVHDVHVTSSNIRGGVVKRLVSLEFFTIRCHKGHCCEKYLTVVAFFLSSSSCRSCIISTLFICCNCCTFRSVTATVMRSSPAFAPKGWHYIRPRS